MVRLAGHVAAIINARLPLDDTSQGDSAVLWRIEICDGRVKSVTRQESEQAASSDASVSLGSSLDAKGSLILPSFCHSHIHIDKCFILDRCEIRTGQFSEALKITGEAKAKFPSNQGDIYSRGERLIRESIQYGVTSMRTHVEVDTMVGFACLDAALALKDRFKSVCDIQIAVFAQEPLFEAAGNAEPGRNFMLLQEAARREGISAVGSAPYVEPTTQQAKSNISLIMNEASRLGLHVDFHLDYNLDPNSEALVWEVVSQARQNSFWRLLPEPEGPNQRHITIGHATRLQLFDRSEWLSLTAAMKELPLHLVGLPQSDMYILGKNQADQPLGPPRGTLRVPYLRNEFGLDVAMSVNNVSNAFTPQGSLDPLSLCTLGVALFQSATPKDVNTLFRSVSLTSKAAIGQEVYHRGLFPKAGDPADMVIIHGADSLESAVFYSTHDRTTIYSGKVVAQRKVEAWVAGGSPE